MLQKLLSSTRRRVERWARSLYVVGRRYGHDLASVSLLLPGKWAPCSEYYGLPVSALPSIISYYPQSRTYANSKVAF